MSMFTSFGRQVGIGLVVGIVWWGLASGAEAALLAYWNFDEPSGVTAGSAASILAPGQLQGGVVHTTAGRFGRALQFDGTDDQVLVGNVVNLFSTLSDKITISFWAYGDDSLPRNSTVFGGKNAAGNRVLNAHLPWSNGRVYWDAGNSGSAYDRIDKAATTSAIKGQWNHWAFTKDATAGVMKIYLNGQLWQITAPSGTSSAALNKPATQSSTYSVAEASRAVDGNTDGNYWNGSVTHTNSEYQPWWRVDLASEIPIHDIVLFNRSDCCWDRLSNFHVSIFDAGMNEVFRRDLFTTEINPSSDRIPIHVGGVTGRYIQVQLNNTGSARPLSLAEVVVNGTPQTPQTYRMTGITSFAIGSEIGTVFWPGRIDDFAIWNEVLSDAQIAALASGPVVISSATIQSSITNSGGILNPGGEGTIGTTRFASGNLALQTRGSTATQSSTAYGGVPTRAIDGNTDGNFWNNSVTHTNDEYQPWWRVDLGTPASLRTITLWNRTDCCGERLSDFRVSVLDDSLQEVWGGDYFTQGGYPNPSFSITLPGNIQGRYVQVQLRGANPPRPLSLAEVQVEGGLDYTQTDNGVLVVDVDAASGTADKLIVPGTLRLGGTLRLNLLSGEPAIGSSFDILDWGVLVGQFDRLELPPFSRPAIFWDTSRLYTEGILSVGVPEPSTALLFVLGILGLILGKARLAGRP